MGVFCHVLSLSFAARSLEELKKQIWFEWEKSSIVWDGGDLWGESQSHDDKKTFQDVFYKIKAFSKDIKFVYTLCAFYMRVFLNFRKGKGKYVWKDREYISTGRLPRKIVRDLKIGVCNEYLTIATNCEGEWY